MSDHDKDESLAHERQTVANRMAEMTSSDESTVFQGFPGTNDVNYSMVHPNRFARLLEIEAEQAERAAEMAELRALADFVSNASAEKEGWYLVNKEAMDALDNWLDEHPRGDGA